MTNHATRLALVVLTPLYACDQPPVSDLLPEVPISVLSTISPESTSEQEPFGRVADIELDADGNVYVLDGLSRTIRVFSAMGEELRSFARRGEGPGELERPAHLLWGPQGNLWVLDTGNGRLTAFTRDGDLLTTARPVEVPLVFPFALGFAGNGTLRWVGATSPGLSNMAAGWVETEIADGVVQVLSEVDLPFVEWPFLFEHRTESMVLAFPVPFGGEPRFAFDPVGRLWYAHTAAPVIHRWDEEGAGLSITLDIAPAPVSDDDRANALADPEYEEVHQLGEAIVQEVYDMIPETRPFLDGFFLDDTGHIWVVREPTVRSERLIDVYDADGLAVGYSRTTLQTQPTPRLRAGVLAAVIRDSLDVESIVTYRVDTNAISR